MTAVASQDITYLDDFLRITRGGDGSLFVLVKESATGRLGRGVPHQCRWLMVLTIRGSYYLGVYTRAAQFMCRPRCGDSRRARQEGPSRAAEVQLSPGLHDQNPIG